MLGYPFYHGTIRKTIAAFGSLFSDIKVATVDGGGIIRNAMTVPLRYAGMDKTLLEPDPTAKPFNEVFPRMTYELSQISYDPDRKTNALNKIGNVFAPTPYVADFGLYILSRNMGDALQILEQILPYFNPTLTLQLEDTPLKGAKVDLPITITAVSISDDYEGEESQKRRVEISLNFQIVVSLFRNIGSDYENALSDFIIKNYDPEDPTTCSPPRKPLVPGNNNKVIYKVITNIFDSDEAFCAKFNNDPSDDHLAIPASTVTVAATAREIMNHNKEKDGKEVRVPSSGCKKC